MQPWQWIENEAPDDTTTDDCQLGIFFLKGRHDGADDLLQQLLPSSFTCSLDLAEFV